MKKVKKLLCLLLSMAMVLCLAVPAFAVGDTYTLTINSETPNHDYEVYQIFSGTLTENESGEKVLSHMAWGNGVGKITVNFSTQLDIAYTVQAGLTNPFAGTDWGISGSKGTFEDGIEALNGLQDNSQELDIFASVVNKWLAASPTATGSTVKSGDKYVATIDDLEPGYYLIKETAFTGTEGDNNAYTKFMLQVVGDTTVNAKADVPTITKKIVENGTELVDAAEASIGDMVSYRLETVVPEMDGYNKYYFIVTDTLSEGLTPYTTSLIVKLDGYRLTYGDDYTVSTSNVNGKTQMTIVFKDFIQYKTVSVGKSIVITYNAQVNDKAVVGTTGNPNAVTLEYSNDPNFDYEGVDEPLTDEPTGETPEDITVVYVAGVQLNKVDSKGLPLTGAEFTITGDGVVKTGVTKAESFEPLSGGSYYKLKNGAYTNKPATVETQDRYDTEAGQFIPSFTTSFITKDGTHPVKGEVGADGVIKFTGLGAGSYTIEETVVPAGYNKIDNITLTLNCVVLSEITDGTEKCEWSGSYQIGNEAPVPITATTVGDSGIITFDVVNHTGAELPSTGGMGTTLFLYGGAGLMVLALAALALSKKKNRDGE